MIERLEKICKRLVLKIYFAEMPPDEHRRLMSLYSQIQMAISDLQEATKWNNSCNARNVLEIRRRLRF